MSTSALSSSLLEETIQRSGEGWLLENSTSHEKPIDRIRRALLDVHNRAKERMGANAPDITEETLSAEYRRNPQRVRGFLQALGATCSPDMLLMTWRILQGMEVKDVQISYHRQQDFKATVVLESPYGEADSPYISNDISDFTLFRHIGAFDIGGRPVFDGFYALRLREPKISH